MGGNAFYYLYTPRIQRDLYLKVRDETSKALQKIFRHVAVPYEMPSKTDFGDIDFLVAGPIHTSTKTFDYAANVAKVKDALGTPHGFRGVKNPGVMFFAVAAPGREYEFWVQVDLKVCENPEMFEWERFQLNYATASMMIGSMIKPLGLTIDPKGLHLRVDGMGKVNLEKSMVFITKEPKEVLKMVGLDKRLLGKGFGTNEEVFKYLIGSWVFNATHFKERLKDQEYLKRLSDGSAPWLPFVQRWLPERFPDDEFPRKQESDLTEWYADMRQAVRDKVLSTYPSKAREYYEKRREYTQEAEEHRLRELLKTMIPQGRDGWTDDHSQVTIILKPSTPSATASGPFDSPFMSIASPNSSSDTASSSPTRSPRSSISSDSIGTCVSEVSSLVSSVGTPLFLDSLPRTPPVDFRPILPPKTMSIEAKLLCLARWTLFDNNGTPYLTTEALKEFEMNWAGSGAEDEELLKWVKEMWWPIWKRQCRVNYVGMWKKRFEKEDKKKAKEMDGKVVDEKETGEGDVVGMAAEETGQRFAGRMVALNAMMGVERQALGC